MKVGFIGLGVMGAPMALNLQNAGHEIFTLQHRSPTPQDLLDGGTTVCANAKEIAEKADIIITVLPNTPQVEQTLFGENGLGQGLTPGKLVIDMSTISPVETKKFAAKIAELECEYLDAPVSGGDIGAQAGTLAIMVGGKQAAFDRAKPLFDIMGQSVTLVGENGAGQITKLANNMVVAMNIEAVAEAIVFAKEAGADPAKVREALLGGFAGSKVLDVHGQRMLERNFEPGFRITLHQKDLQLALDSAKELGVELPNTQAVQDMFNECANDDDADKDHSALVKVIEKRTKSAGAKP